MLQRALDLNIFDSVMVGFNNLNPSAKKKYSLHATKKSGHADYVC